MDWQKWAKETDGDINAVMLEVIRLQEKVKALEKRQAEPDEAFWGQLMFDVFMFAFVFYTLVCR